MQKLRFVRCGDGLTYEFVRAGAAYGYPAYRRGGSDIWCRRLPDYGWAVSAESGVVLSRPFDDAGRGAQPPTGVWVSRKGEKSYIYHLFRSDEEA